MPTILNKHAKESVEVHACSVTSFRSLAGQVSRALSIKTRWPRQRRSGLVWQKPNNKKSDLWSVDLWMFFLDVHRSQVCIWSRGNQKNKPKCEVESFAKPVIVAQQQSTSRLVPQHGLPSTGIILPNPNTSEKTHAHAAIGRRTRGRYEGIKGFMNEGRGWCTSAANYWFHRRRTQDNSCAGGGGLSGDGVNSPGGQSLQICVLERPCLRLRAELRSWQGIACRHVGW